jgi:predicted nucleic acid-binding Zn ribbon protein
MTSTTSDLIMNYLFSELESIETNKQKVNKFNNKVYKLYPGENYYSRGTKRLHRIVWEYYNGVIQDGYHVHHKDGNKLNNDINNLECLPMEKHISEHSKQYHKQNKDVVIEHLDNIRKLTKEWHGSEEGYKWHSENGKRCWENKEVVIRQCEQCGKEYSTKTHHQKYCSNTCKSTARRNSGVDNIIRRCEVCGTEFTTDKYTKIKCCSTKCRSILGYRTRRNKRASI